MAPTRQLAMIDEWDKDTRAGIISISNALLSLFIALRRRMHLFYLCPTAIHSIPNVWTKQKSVRWCIRLVQYDMSEL
jgi:hypothetical protein